MQSVHVGLLLDSNKASSTTAEASVLHNEDNYVPEDG